jgi:hypothetical protein
MPQNGSQQPDWLLADDDGDRGAVRGLCSARAARSAARLLLGRLRAAVWSDPTGLVVGVVDAEGRLVLDRHGDVEPS